MKIKKMNKRLNEAIALLRLYDESLDYEKEDEIEKAIKGIQAAIGLIEAYDDLKNENNE